jgi:hypothetical protein
MMYYTYRLEISQKMKTNYTNCHEFVREINYTNHINRIDSCNSCSNLTFTICVHKVGFIPVLKKRQW